jgi:hypothetical protein
MNNPITNLIELHQHYEIIIAHSEYQAAQAKEQLVHIDALLENGLLQTQEFPRLETVEIASPQAIAATIEPASPPVAKASTAIAKAPAATTEAVIAPIESPTLKTDPTKKRISLMVLPAYEGLTKLDAIATVLEKNLGEMLHQDTIIQMLYGDLSLEDLKKERVRMDTCLRNGVKVHKWKKAPVAARYVLESAAAGKPKRPGRKPEPTKEPKPQPEPVAEAVEAIAPVESRTAKPTLGRKPAIAKAKTSRKPARPKRSEVELMALLSKADRQV